MVMTNLLMNARDSLVARFVGSGVGIFFSSKPVALKFSSCLFFLNPVLTGNKPVNFRPTDEGYFYTLARSNQCHYQQRRGFLPAIFVVM